MKVKIINKSHNQLPAYATSGSAGVDLRASLAEDFITIAPFSRVLVPTGLFMEIPEGYEGQVRPRSGLAAKQGLTVLNTPGTIDSDYRGEIKVILYNSTDSEVVLANGVRIAQMVFAKCEHVEFEEVEEIGDTKRGDGGFGHTGVK